MTRYRQNEDEFPTVLDCLLYEKSEADGDHLRERDPLLASIARDLEALLNSRRREGQIPDQYVEARRSILTFGVPEFDQYGGLAAASERTRLCQTMETAIQIFEPRLTRVSVRMLDRVKSDNALRFRIEATIGQIDEEEVFEAGLKRDSNTISITHGGAA
jgi:type VI secretion system protein ImpF